jgi:hypothetical protein
MKTSLLVRSRLLGGRFSPQTLFALSEPGVWYDPSDLTTMFTDTAGTTPATVGSAVALLLDKSLGATEKLGPELVTNGAFTSGTDWTLGAGWTIGSGVATKTAVTAEVLSQTVSLTTGRAYELTYTMTRTAGTLTPRITGGTTVNFTARTAGGTYTQIVSVVTGNTTLEFSADALFVGTVDNVTLKILTGFHATQATLAARPILGRVPSVGRRNLLVRTEEFDNAAWAKTSATVTANTTADPNGIVTADSLIETATSDRHFIRVTQNPLANTTYTLSIYAKSLSGNRFLQIALVDGGTGKFGSFDIENGVLGAVQDSGVTRQIVSLGNGWFRCSISYTMSATPGTNQNVDILLSSSDIRAQTYLGDGTSGLFIWGAQLEFNSTASAYQRVTSTFDVTEAGQPDNYYLSFDGVDDSMVTPTITPGVDKVQVFAGVRKLSDAARGWVIETSTDANQNNGAVWLTTPRNIGVADAQFSSRGTIPITASSSVGAAPNSMIMAGIGDIAGDNAALRINGTQVAQDPADQGTGNYLAYPLYIGRRAGTSLEFNGQIYSLIVRFGANLTNDQIVTTEKWVSGKTAGVTL